MNVSPRQSMQLKTLVSEVHMGSRHCQAKQPIPIDSDWLREGQVTMDRQSKSNSRSFLGSMGKRGAPFLMYFQQGEQSIHLAMSVPSCQVNRKGKPA